MKKQEAITLISLVITIIILIILAGIGIYLNLGNNGIFTRAQQAKEKYINATQDEQSKLNSIYGQLLLATNDDAELTIKVKDLKQMLQENKTTETVLWQGIANEVKEYDFEKETYDIDNYDRIIIEYSQEGIHKCSTSVSTKSIEIGKKADIGLWGYDDRYTTLHFLNNKFVIDVMGGKIQIYVNRIIGIKY